MQTHDLLEAIWEHWVFHREIPVDTANEMRQELADHLAEARADGKDPSVVTGPDLRSFADDWAEATSDTPKPNPLLTAAFSVAGAVSGLAFVATVVTRSLDFPIPVFDGMTWLVYFAGVAIVVFAPWASRLRATEVPITQPRMTVIFGACGLVGFLVLMWITSLLPNEPTITAPKAVVAILAFGGALLTIAIPAQAFGFSPLRKLGNLIAWASAST